MEYPKKINKRRGEESRSTLVTHTMTDKLPSIDDFYEELPSKDEVIKEEKLPSINEFVEEEEEDD